ncbi:MAG: hypothetical protein JO359_05505, partial [Candidatus Eremiobacteraeota bacterium]|nr:hypothetical protein [Candidatus Eremiobacteraeota bacterium]
MKKAVVVLLVILSFAVQTPAAPQPAEDLAARRIAEIFTASQVDPDWFAASFLTQVPAAQVTQIAGQVKAALGEYRSVAKSGDHYIATFSKGTEEITIHLDASGKIDGLFFKSPQPAAASLEDALRRFGSLAGTVSYVV